MFTPILFQKGFGFKVMAHSGYLVNFNHPFLEKLSVCLFNVYIGNTTASLQIRFCNKRTLFSKFSMNNLKSLLKLWCICNITSCSRKCLNKNYGYPVPDQESQNHDPLAGTYPYRFCERVHPPPHPRGRQHKPFHPGISSIAAPVHFTLAVCMITTT